MRSRGLVIALAGLIVVAACGGTADTPSSGEGQTTTSSSSAQTTAVSVTTVATTEPSTPPNSSEPREPVPTSAEAGPSSTEATIGTVPVTTEEVPSPVASSTTAPEPFPAPRSPLTGLAVTDPSAWLRRVVAVKIDNHPEARPQSGIEQADAVFELVVEGGLTRFIGLFHSHDDDWAGPMRSLRPTDWTLVKPLGGVLMISGGQPWIVESVLANDVAIIGDLGPPLTNRWGTRRAPHNLYVNTAEARREADQRGLPDAPPAPLFNRGEFSASPSAGATYMFFDWSDNTDVVWHWDGVRYLRSVEGVPHEWVSRDGTSGQISADVLVVLMAERYTACPSGQGSCVPAWRTVGENRALVFAQGLVEEGRWSRNSAGEYFALTNSSGSQITLPPGRTWIMIYPETADLIW